MSEFLSETEGCNLLTRLFRSRGYSIARNLPFREYGVEFHIDGWDAQARVGFEFLTSEDEDHDDLSLAEHKTLSDAQQRGELALFIIDEVEPLSPADLTASANEFLDEVAEAVRARSTAGNRSRGKPPAKKKSAKAKKAVPKGSKKAGRDAKSAARKASPPAAAKAAKRPTGKATKKAGRKVVKKTAKKVVQKTVKKKVRRAQ